MPTINTTYGPIRGKLKDGCEDYLGIPFAKPPVGELAFRRPLPPDPWHEVRDATVGPNNPIQPVGYFSCNNNDEDCLYLNVFAPQGERRGLPVMVWIFGGSYAYGGVGRVGGGDGLAYDLELFARETNTIVVAPNYRINLYGFSGMNCLSDRFESNVGLYDLALALEFVHDNAVAFGGDPRNVTVFGESAGGALTLALMSSAKTSHLFQKAIAQSACVNHFWTMDEARILAKRILRYAGIDERRPNDVLGLSPTQVRGAAARLIARLKNAGEIRCAFSPVIDGNFLEDYPKDLARTAPHELLIGCVSHDGDLFVNRVPDAGLRVMALASGVSVPKGADSYRHRLGDAVTNAVFREPCRQIADGRTGNTWAYEFDYASRKMREQGIRPQHVCDLYPLFGSEGDLYDASDPDFARVGQAMRALWADLAWSRMEAAPYVPGGHNVIAINNDGVSQVV